VSPYTGRVGLEDVIVRIEIDDIDRPAWRGTLQTKPQSLAFASGAVVVPLLQGERGGWQAAATSGDIGGRAMLFGLAAFEAHDPA
jgi:hypothetical protein